jgi:hypothetical protein
VPRRRPFLAAQAVFALAAEQLIEGLSDRFGGKVMPQGVYRSPEAFRTALQQRIRRAVGGGNVGRFRQMLVLERFLARVFHHFGTRATLKGGVVLELRLKRARTTRDVDLRLVGGDDDIVAALRTLGAVMLDDWLSFEVEPDAHLAWPAAPRRPSTGCAGR